MYADLWDILTWKLVWVSRTGRGWKNESMKSTLCGDSRHSPWRENVKEQKRKQVHRSQPLTVSWKVLMKRNMAGACSEVKSTLLMCEQAGRDHNMHIHIHTHSLRGDLWGSKEQLKMRYWTMYDRSVGMSVWLLRKAQCSHHNSDWWRVWAEGQRVHVCTYIGVCVFHCYLWM